MHLWGEPELLTDVIMHCDAFITGENEPALDAASALTVCRMVYKAGL